MLNVRRIVQNDYGEIFKDERSFSFNEELNIKNNEKKWKFDLTSVIQHMGGTNAGHYICAKRSWITLKPMIKDRDKTQQLFKFLNWNLISDTGNNFF